MGISVFDIVRNLNDKGEGPLSTEMIQAEYSPFVINRAMSNVKATLYFANEMNLKWQLPKEMQYDFYFYGVSKKKRFGKWNKLQGDKETIAAIQEYYNYSFQRAKETISLLTEEQINKIKKAIDRGGTK